MASSPHSGAQAARDRIALALRDLRRDAGINARILSERCQWSAAKTSRMEHGKIPPSDQDIRAWCQACGQPQMAPDLIAANRAADQLYVEWRRRQRSGLRHIQEATLALSEQAGVERVYCSNVLPGFFQTAAYTRAMFETFVRFEDIPDDIDEAVASRGERAQLLHEGGRRFVVLLEETVLRYSLGGPATMIDQLEHLLTVARLPSVALGVIPFAADRSIMWPLEAFYLFDNTRVVVETLTAEINVTSPQEIRLYERAFLELGRMAVYGPPAQALIRHAMRELH
ncbi:transcriptional regulator with XRE-family HTH domain [Streptacidiphilus sp. BW17]|uniref:helix-turn-helix domain-containing protein n=1 Tax=Streptacidiphilus sp. BW17 TaxID=3156274 RepID=UPI003513E3F3